MSVYNLRLYEWDDATVVLGDPTFTTDPAGARPYLIVPDEMSEASVNPFEGSATIGQINIELVDYPLTPGDQDSGIVTSLLVDRLGGRRVLLTRVLPSLAETVVVDGIIHKISLNEDASSYTVILRDPRQRMRKMRLFHTAMLRDDTDVILQAPSILSGGPYTPWGKLVTTDEGTTYLEQGIPLPAIYDANEHIFKQDWVDQRSNPWIVNPNVVDQAGVAVRRYGESGEYEGTFFDRVVLLWRARGSVDPWTEATNLRTTQGVLVAGEGYQFGNLFRTETDDEGNTRVTALNIESEDVGVLPAHEQEVDLWLLYRGEPTPELPLYIEDTAGGILQSILEGRYREDTTLASTPLYDAAAISALVDTTPLTRGKIESPVDDGLKWLQENIFKPFRLMPTLDPSYRLSPTRFDLPDASEALLVLDADNFDIDGTWEEDADAAVTVVRALVKFDPNFSESELTFKSATYTDVGEKEVTLQGDLLRAYYGGATTGSGGRRRAEPRKKNSNTTSIYDEGSIIPHILTFKQMIFDRSRHGVQIIEGSALRSDPSVEAAKVGDWAHLQIPYLPDVDTGRRGMDRVAQIIAIRDTDEVTRYFVLHDGGPAVQPVSQPTAGALTVETGKVAVPVATIPDGEAHVMYAIVQAGAPAPSENSGLWKTAGRVGTPSTVYTETIAAGRRVWVRVRGEAEGRRPSAWRTPVDIVIPTYPMLIDFWIEINDEGKLQARWRAAGNTAGVRIYYTAHDDPTPPDAFVGIIDTDASLGVRELPQLVYADHKFVTARAEAWSGFSVDTVSGTKGQTLVDSIATPANDTLWVDLKSPEWMSIFTPTFPEGGVKLRLQGEVGPDVREVKLTVSYFVEDIGFIHIYSVDMRGTERTFDVFVKLFNSQDIVSSNSDIGYGVTAHAYSDYNGTEGINVTGAGSLGRSSSVGVMPPRDSGMTGGRFTKSGQTYGMPEFVLGANLNVTTDPGTGIATLDAVMDSGEVDWALGYPTYDARYSQLSHNHDSVYAPLVHASRHSSGGADPITPGMIGAAAAVHIHAWGDITSGVPVYATRWPSFSEVTSRPTTLLGYGITDAYTKTEIDTHTSLMHSLNNATSKGQLLMVGGTSLSPNMRQVEALTSSPTVGRFLRIQAIDANGAISYEWATNVLTGLLTRGIGLNGANFNGASGTTWNVLTWGDGLSPHGGFEFGQSGTPGKIGFVQVDTETSPALYRLAVVLGTSFDTAARGDHTHTGVYAPDVHTHTNLVATTTFASGQVPVNRGGTGRNTLTSNALLTGAGTSQVNLISPGTSGNVLMSNGTVWASTVPPWTTLSAVLAHPTLLKDGGGISSAGQLLIWKQDGNGGVEGVSMTGASAGRFLQISSYGGVGTPVTYTWTNSVLGGSLSPGNGIAGNVFSGVTGQTWSVGVYRDGNILVGGLIDAQVGSPGKMGFVNVEGGARPVLAAVLGTTSDTAAAGNHTHAELAKAWIADATSGALLSGFSGDLNNSSGFHAYYASSGATNRPAHGNSNILGFGLSGYTTQIAARGNWFLVRQQEAGVWGAWRQISEVGHTHTTGEVSGLQAALDGKASMPSTGGGGSGDGLLPGRYISAQDNLALITQTGGVPATARELRLQYRLVGASAVYYDALRIADVAGGFGFMQLMRSGGNIGIGYTSDQGYKLAVNGTGYFSSALAADNLTLIGGGSSSYTSPGTLALKTAANNAFISWHNSAGTRLGYIQFSSSLVRIAGETAVPMLFDTNGAGTNRMRIEASGNIGIGYTSDQGYRFAVNGSGYFASNVTVSGTFTATNLFKTSARWLKRDIEDLSLEEAQRVLSLRMYRYRWKLTGELDWGWIADDVDPLFSTRGWESVRSDMIYAGVLRVVQDHEKRLLSNEERIAVLEMENAELKQKVQELMWGN